MTVDYALHDIAPYINWIYFFHAWGFQPRFATISNIHGCDACRASWLTSFAEADRPKASEAMQLFKEAQKMIAQLDADYATHASFVITEAYSDGDDICLDEFKTRIPMLRQQKSRKGEPNLCLSDYVAPKHIDRTTIGLFATTIDKEVETLYGNDDYKHLLVQTVADRLSEATAEKMHEEIRKKYWGYAPDENLTVAQLHSEEFTGIRPAIGYPSLPDQSIVFLLSDILKMENIGIRLTENGAMIPHASTCGLMFAHPQASYFSVGKISEEQLADYAKRRGLPCETVRKFLTANL